MSTHSSRRPRPEKKSVHTTHHTDKIWLYILLEQTFLIIIGWASSQIVVSFLYFDRLDSGTLKLVRN